MCGINVLGRTLPERSWECVRVRTRHTRRRGPLPDRLSLIAARRDGLDGLACGGGPSTPWPDGVAASKSLASFSAAALRWPR